MPDRTAHRERLSAVFNFRDLGGLPAADGRTVRCGVLFRSDSFHEAPAADVEYLAGELGIRRVLDLRSETEVDADSAGALARAGADYQQFPIGNGPGDAIAAAPSGQRLALRYRQYLEHFPDSLVGVLRAVAATDGEPTVIHCRAGKDRTGVAVALLLSVLGVSDEDVAADYALTGEAMDRILERLRASPTYAANTSALPDEMYRAEAETMRRFLDELRERDGGAAAWLTAHGLTETELATLRTELLEHA